MTSPDNITELELGQIFVYGTNAKGIHAGGAALQARQFGALYGVSEGPTGGQTYGIVTLDQNMSRKPLASIREQAEKLNFIAQCNPDYEFLLTRVGCGIAGYSEDEVKPFFADMPSNVIKPKGW